jgi:hypothetical protein
MKQLHLSNPVRVGIKFAAPSVIRQNLYCKVFIGNNYRNYLLLSTLPFCYKFAGGRQKPQVHSRIAAMIKKGHCKPLYYRSCAQGVVAHSPRLAFCCPCAQVIVHAKHGGRPVGPTLCFALCVLLYWCFSH